jgi:uncharacterized protein (DUF697 family)
MSNKPNQLQTNDGVLGRQSSLASLSQCPVCKTEYTQSEVNRCSVCNWDLTPCPEAFLDRQNVQVGWAREIWVKLQVQEKQLHIKINAEIDANPQLSALREESDLEIWNLLITWVCGVDLDAAKTAVERLQNRYQGKEPRQIARILILHKCCQAAGVELVKGIPAVNELLNGLVGVDLPIVTILSAEMIYQIAAIYGLDIQAPERKLEVLAAFGVALLGERAIKVGLDWLKYGLMPGQLISASTKALMIYALGNAACLFYEAQVNHHINPLNSPAAFDDLRQDSQDYLKYATSENEINNIIFGEIETTPLRLPPPKPIKNHDKKLRKKSSNDSNAKYNRLRSLLEVGNWKEANEETRQVMLKVAGCQSQGWLDSNSINEFPLTELRKIDKLWVKYSRGHFGFSVQKRIYQEVGKDFEKFGACVGWNRVGYFKIHAGRKNWFGGKKPYEGQSLIWIHSIHELTFSTQAPRGHLPVVGGHEILSGGRQLLSRPDLDI